MTNPWSHSLCCNRSGHALAVDRDSITWNIVPHARRHTAVIIANTQIGHRTNTFAIHPLDISNNDAEEKHLSCREKEYWPRVLSKIEQVWKPDSGTCLTSSLEKYFFHIGLDMCIFLIPFTTIHRWTPDPFPSNKSSCEVNASLLDCLLISYESVTNGDQHRERV